MKKALTTRSLGKAALSGLVIASLAGTGIASYSMPAYAADGSVTITSQANDGETYNAYRLFTADVDEQNNATHISWGPQLTDHATLISFLDENGYATWLTDNNKGAADNAQNAADFIADKIGTESPDNETIVDGDTFAHKLAQWCKDNITTPDATVTEGEQYTGPEGYYLFVTAADESDVIGTAPIWFALGGSSTTVNAKSSAPTITKEIVGEGNHGDFEIGDDISYKITTALPGNYNTFDSFYFQVSDTIPAGMTIEQGDVIVKHGETDITSQFQVSVSGQEMTVTADDLKAITEQFSAGDQITVEYTVDFDKLSGIDFGNPGNINEATFTYSNDPHSDTHGTMTPETTKTHVYSFQLAINKTDSGNDQAVDGASFTIANADGNYLKKDSASGTYSWTGAEGDAYKFTTANGGKIERIPGLEAGTYTLKEVEAADGYALPADQDFTVTITPQYDESGNLTTLGASVETGNDSLAPSLASEADLTEGLITINVTNDRQFVLAMTGAQGATLIGVLIVAAGIALYAIGKKKSGKKNTAENE